MTDGGDVASEVLLHNERRGCQTQVQLELLVTARDTGEILDPLERNVQLDVLLLDIVAQCQDVRPELLIPIADLRRGIAHDIHEGLVGTTATRRFRLGPGAWGALSLGGYRGRMHQFKHQQIGWNALIPDQADVAIDLSDGVFVILREVAGDTYQARVMPVDAVGGGLAQSLEDQQLELASVIHEPVQVEQPLGDDVLIDASFVFDDDGGAVLVNAQGVHSAAVALPGRVLSRQESDAEQDVQ